MSDLKRILMTRDKLSEKEADDLLDETREMMMEAIAVGDFEEAEEIYTSMLGIEPDYMPELVQM